MLETSLHNDSGCLFIMQESTDMGRLDHFCVIVIVLYNDVFSRAL